MTKNSLESFVEGIKKAWGPLTSETVANCQRLLEELAKAPVFDAGLEELLQNPGAEKELYRDPEHGFVLSAYTEAEGRYRVPHDHGSGWVIYAVQNGEMEMGTYARTVSQRGQMSLVLRESSRMQPGDCRVFLPGDIHDTRCASSSALVLRFTSCDLKKEDREGRMIRYPDAGSASKPSFLKTLAIAFFFVLATSGAVSAEDRHSGWSLHFTPALVAPSDGYKWGGGFDPELRRSFGFAGVFLSFGARTGAYYAKNIFGVMAMPTARLTIPAGAWDTYAALGAGYGRLPRLDHSDLARMYRVGVVYHFSPKFKLGLEGTQQDITHSNFRFFSLGSMISFGL